MRLFIATSFPAEILRDLNSRVGPLRSRLPSASRVREEAQHLTFAFLGEHPESLVEEIAPPLAQSLATIARFEARLRGCGFFPNPRRARVGWIGIEPERSFTTVAQAVREVVTKHGVTLDGGEFKPHLTVMRIRDQWPPASIELFNRSLGSYRSEAFTLEAVTLYWSQLDPKGAIHTPLRRFALA